MQKVLAWCWFAQHGHLEQQTFVDLLLTEYGWESNGELFKVEGWYVCKFHNFNCLCRLQLYTDVHGHITDLDKEVCMTNICYPSFRFSA